MSAIESNTSCNESISLYNRNLEAVSRWTKVVLPLMALGGLATMNLGVITKLAAAPLVAKATQVVVDLAAPLTKAMVKSVMSVKDLFKQPLKVTIPTVLAAGYGLSSGASLGYSLAQGAIYGFNAHSISNSKSYKEFFVQSGTAAGAVYGLNVAANLNLPVLNLPALNEGVRCVASLATAIFFEYGFNWSSSAVYGVLNEPFKEKPCKKH